MFASGNPFGTIVDEPRCPIVVNNTSSSFSADLFNDLCLASVI